MLIIFSVVCLCIIFLSYKREGKLLNLVSLITIPYLIIIPLNNIYFIKNGFYEISNRVIFLLTTCLFTYFLGVLSIKPVSIQNKVKIEDNSLGGYNIKRMTLVLYFISIIASIKLLYAIKNGILFSVNSEQEEGYMSSGLVGHLLNLSYVLLPYVFLYWTYYKKTFYFIPIILIIVAIFSTFIKYHIIGLFFILYLFVGLYKKISIYKSSGLLATIVFGIFCLNYFVGFFFSESLPDSEFYTNHFWKYVSGSLIHDNYIFTTGIRPETSIWYKLGTFLSAFPNMFLSLVDEKIFPPIPVGWERLSNFGEDGNVICAFGALYPSKGNGIDIIMFYIIIYLIALFSKFIINYRALKMNGKPDVFVVVFLTFFVFFSFFGTFYQLSTPWEILIYALIIPPLFNINTKIKLFNFHKSLKTIK